MVSLRELRSTLRAGWPSWQGTGALGPRWWPAQPVGHDGEPGIVEERERFAGEFEFAGDAVVDQYLRASASGADRAAARCSIAVKPRLCSSHPLTISSAPNTRKPTSHAKGEPMSSRTW